MSRGKKKYKQGKRIIQIKKNQDNDALNPLSDSNVPPHLRPMVEGLKRGFEQRVKYAEFKALHQYQKLHNAINEIKANQIVLQTLIFEKNIINRRTFTEEYQRYLTDIVGIVDGGRMQGFVVVDTFNIGVPLRGNSLNELKNKNKNPIIISRS
jgi:hypothetical protein